MIGQKITQSYFYPFIINTLWNAANQSAPITNTNQITRPDIKSKMPLDTEAAVALCICLVCICVMSFYLRDRVVLFYPNMSFANYVATAQLGASWLFSFISIMSLALVDGEEFFCGFSIYVCATIYASTKVLIYVFLIERARAVRGMGKNSRLKDRQFLLNWLFVMPYTVIGIVLILNVGFRLKNNEEQDCYIGAYRTATLPLIVYDTFYSAFLTSQFVAPLHNNSDPRLAKIAKRNLIGSLASLLVSFANILSLVLDESQPAYQCLTSCVVDVFLNVLILHLLLTGLRSKITQKTRTTSQYNNKPTSTHTQQVVRPVPVNTGDTKLPGVSMEEDPSTTGNSSSGAVGGVGTVIKVVAGTSRRDLKIRPSS